MDCKEEKNIPIKKVNPVDSYPGMLQVKELSQ